MSFELELLICAILLGLMGFADKIPLNSWFYRLNYTFSKVTAFILLTIAGYLITQRKDSQTQIMQAQSDSTHNAAYKHLQDSLHNDLIEQLRRANDSSLRTYTSALAQYNLQYMNGQVSLKAYLKDSVQNEIPGMYIPTSLVRRYYNRNKDSLKLHFPFMNSGNCPILVTMTGATAGDVNGNLQYGWKIEPLNKLYIAQGSAYDYITGLQYHDILLNRIYFNINSYYTDKNGKKKVNYNEIIIWDRAKDTVGLCPTIQLRDSIQRFFRAHKS